MIKSKIPFKVAIIEDNTGDFILIREYLYQQIGKPEITQVKDFQEAQLILSGPKSDFDIILLDLTLPDNSGEKLLLDILQLAGSCPVIVLTGYGDLEFSIKSLSLGVGDYLLKDDINATSLFKSILYCLERRKNLMQLKQSELRYINIFNANPQPMWLYHPETLQIIQVNKAAIDQYGYTEEEFLSGTLALVVRNYEFSELQKEIEENKPESINFFKGRFIHYKKSGEQILVEIYTSPIELNANIYYLSILVDVTEKILLEKKLIKQKVEEQRKIAKAVVNAQERERAEIGIELHDNVNQLLAGSKLYLNHCLTLPNGSKEYIAKSQEYLSQAMDELRKLSHSLVGPDKSKTVGLIESIDKIVSDISALKNIKIIFNYNSSEEELLERQIEEGLKLNIYRIIQEQINNILKHANATEVVIELKRVNDGLRISVRDNGGGFELRTKKEGIGLLNIKSRAEMYNGTVDISSSPGNGCSLIIFFKTAIPVKEEM